MKISRYPRNEAWTTGDKIVVYSEKDAWDVASKYFKDGYTRDDYLSKRAGYPIYISNTESSNAHISDLNTRLEVNLDNGKTINIWINQLSDYDIKEISRILDDFIYDVEDKISSEFRERSGLDDMLRKAYQIGKKYLGWKEH